MQEVFEKIIERLEEKKRNIEPWLDGFTKDIATNQIIGINAAIEIVNQVAEEYEGKFISVAAYKQVSLERDIAIEQLDRLEEKISNGWIPCSERLPKAEEEVFVLTEKGTMTTAMYEDGTVYSSDSEWLWYDCDFEYDEEKEDYIIPEGWWEYRHFNIDECYNNVIDAKVIAWRPLPEAYKEQKDD